MKRLIGILLACCLLGSCSAGGTGSSSRQDAQPSIAPSLTAADSGGEESGQQLVSVIFGVGGIRDGAFNQLCYSGFVRAAQQLGADMLYYEATTESDYAPNIQKAVEAGSALVVCTGYSMAGQAAQAARENPQIQFVVFDGVPENPPGNLTSVLFAQGQVSYLAGVAAASTTASNCVGFIVGSTGALSETMNTFGYGYIAGVLDTNPDIQVLQHKANSFADLPGGKSAALEMAGQGADVIFHAAGGTGTGVIEGCAEAGIWTIGVDSDQSALSPEHVLTSAMKRVDNAGYHLLEAFIKTGGLDGGVITYDLKTNGVNLAPTTDNLSEQALANIEAAREKIIAGEISIPATREEFIARYGEGVYELT